MMTRWVIRVLFDLAVSGALCISLYAVFWGVEPEARSLYWQKVRRLHALDTFLNEAVLRAHSGLLLSYDPLVFAVTESNKTHEALKEPPLFLPQEGEAELAGLIERSASVSAEKTELVERFKSENAVLRTSLHYFPILITDVADRAASLALPKVGARAQAVAGAVMLFKTTGDSEAETRVHATLASLEQVASLPESAPLRTELTLIERHSRIILERKPIVDRLVRDILATTTTGAQLAVERRYAQLEARALGATIERRHWILALLLGAVIFGMLEVMGSMQRAARTKEKLALELQAAHERLEREHQRELELGAARIRFLAMTSHEIRTRLTTIVSSTEMLMAFGSKWGAERNRDHFERIRVAAEGMKRMVEDILLIGRAEAGNLTSSPAPILLNAFCQELVETFEQQSQGARVIHYEFEGDASVSLDERLLRHVLGNLLSNALKYSAADDGAEIIAPAMRALYEEAARVAASPINVVVLGENGVGKELLSRAIHSFSPRKAGPFVALNCAALSESLVLSELFGYEKGAFTGALQSRAGLLESASGGTLFLDEVGELPLSMQSKLLRVIEEKKVMRVGARTEREVDVRFVAATNRDLDEEVAAGRFRQDLYFRLNGVSLTVPPLRERREEIRPLASMFLARALGSLQAPPLSIDEATFEVLERYPFPGNVRELKNLIERGAALCRGRVLLVEHLPEKVRCFAERSGKSPGSELRSLSESSSWSSFPPSSRRGERHQILEALDKCAGNQTRAAELLGISRRTLVTRLGELDIPRPRKR